ncbi:glycosyltransferase family 4 protein [Anthocerotibacter panamensis]|uniref:glycosyltransferase family 4 protein n=1 Tax=Anthocerotibacter panamensis TaxID=2857077 RepID=UPI001C407064|nr:glycosyltransferase family 1 protein [Anthocerotibacter panamensis]
MIKLAYDYQIFLRQQYGGISRYLCEVAARIAKDKNYNTRVVALAYINNYLSDCPSSLTLGRHIPKVPKSYKVLSKINTEGSKLIFRSMKPDIIHETYYSPNRLAPKKSKVIITVHDMIHEKFINYFPLDRDNTVQVKAKALHRADHIIAVSQNTKKDVVEILGIDPQKISVIYHGHMLKNTPKPSYDTRFPYILYVGERKTYKNFASLLKAFSNDRLLKNDFKIVCFGGGPFSKAEIAMLQDNTLDEKSVIQISGDDGKLAAYYANASAFIYPSFYEGFGIPPLEAMEQQCPVVCSNASSIPEIVGNAGEYFNPYELDSITTALKLVLYSKTRQIELIEAGCKRVKHFTWDKCAKETMKLYQSLL